MIIDTTPDRPRVIGETDLFSAQVLVHTQAIYLHEKPQQYHVDKLDWGERKAYVRKVDADYYTYANRAVTLKPLDVFAGGRVLGGRRIHGEVMVASLVTLFKKLKFGTDENVGWGPIDLPELELQTTAYWLTEERHRRSRGPGVGWRKDDLDVAPLGAGRAIQAVAAVLLMVDPRDLGLVTPGPLAAFPRRRPSTCTRRFPAESGSPSGSGSATRSSSPVREALIEDCAGDEGRPACTGPRLDPRSTGSSFRSGCRP